ncbi:MAG TPA: nitrate reductase molybdenum cofactor assembly chaperone [Hydrogenophaga sp.]|uniref:nitrate reductase molybdenum cofactor assembly chaperone n=1 Tax=Hydrogenophaga sp. TaxID=1904254 RepID=UPI002C88A7BA|nr:nitrate reductase molybdenum cofactor assembly chaperone [Hydrogenophaga sp.]HSX92626.1 nitrate reductase molybdenum cofactor assembly chaperone [Hydrogenophaga sp.]
MKNPFAAERPASHTLRVLARLLSYPDAVLREHAADMARVLAAEGALSPARAGELGQLLLRLARRPALAVEAEFVELFDRGRSTSLHLFEHVHGDSRERGPAMIDLVRTYEQAGLLLREDELPDHLGVLLEYASTQPPAQARALLAETAHILRAIFSALLQKGSPYASVLAAVLELAGERAEAVAVAEDEPLDESWEEPAVFGGCSTAGQSRPAPPQPVRIVRSASSGAQP